ncbi:hypothetical protein AB0L97_32745 [Nocardia sp. NPDC051911]
MALNVHVPHPDPETLLLLAALLRVVALLMFGVGWFVCMVLTTAGML